MQAGRRPRLEIKSVTVTQIYIRGAEVSVFADITYTNIGRAPANNIITKPGLTTLFGMAAKDAQSACDNVSVDKKPGFGPTVFPNGSNTDPVNFIDGEITRERSNYVDEVIRNSITAGYVPPERNTNISKFGVINFIGCVAYTYEGSDDVHGTTFAASALRKIGHWDPDNQGGQGINLERIERIDGSDIETKFYAGGTFAR